METIASENILLLQTLAMPSNANASGDIFGGWLVSQMDMAGAVLAHHRARTRVTTVAIDSMVFLKPVYIGDCIACYGRTLKTGRSSITLQIEVWAVRAHDYSRVKVTQGTFTFVAIDDAGRSMSVDWSRNPDWPFLANT